MLYTMTCAGVELQHLKIKRDLPSDLYALAHALVHYRHHDIVCGCEYVTIYFHAASGL